jgi:hypothetical protein
LVYGRGLCRLPDLQPEHPGAAERHLGDRRSELLIVVHHGNVRGSVYGQPGRRNGIDLP